jgi:hypothetical protein
MCRIHNIHIYGYRQKTIKSTETYPFFCSTSSFSGLKKAMEMKEAMDRSPLIVLTLLIALTATSAFAWSAFAQSGFGARAMAMGGTGILPQNESWAVFNNPAALPDSGITVSFNGTRYFGFSELTETAFSISAAVFGVRTGAGAYTFGFDKYRESGFRMGVKIPYAFAEAGIAAEWRHISIENYSSASALMLDAGLLLHPGGGFSIAGVVGNATASAIGRGRDPLPVVSSVGIGWSVLSRLTLTGAAVKDNRFPVSWRMGAEYRPVPYLDLRSGAMTGPEQFNLGIGIRLNPVKTSISVMNHLDLGWTPSVELTVML